MLPILILFILQNLLYCDLLPSPPMDPEVNDSESTLPSDSFDLILGKHAVGFRLVPDGNAGLVKFVGFGLEVFVESEGAVLIDFEVFALGVGVFGGVLGIDLHELGFAGDSL